LVVKNQLCKRQKRYEAEPNLGKLCDRFCIIKKSRVFTNITQTAGRNRLKIAGKVDKAQLIALIK